MPFHFLGVRFLLAMVVGALTAMPQQHLLITLFHVVEVAVIIGKMWFQRARSAITKRLTAPSRKLVGACARSHVNPSVRLGEF
jgi:hypothetical protein